MWYLMIISVNYVCMYVFNFHHFQRRLNPLEIGIHLGICWQFEDDLFVFDQGHSATALISNLFNSIINVTSFFYSMYVFYMDRY